MLRRLTRHPRFLAAAARLLGLYIAFVHRTTRWTLAVDAAEAAARASGGTIILAFWHERIALGPGVWVEMRRRVPAIAAHRPQVLVSRHRDGVFIGNVVARFGLETVHGSTSRGGTAALRAMLRILRRGGIVAITPDGPRGPRRVAAAGVGQLAAASGAPVLAYAGATSRGIRLGTWDRSLVPLPFGRGLIVLHPPVTVPPHAAEAGRAAIERALTEACDLADAWAEACRTGRGEAEALAAARDFARRAPPVFALPDLAQDPARAASAAPPPGAAEPDGARRTAAGRP